MDDPGMCSVISGGFFLALLPVVPILECGLYMAFGGSVQPAAAA